MSIELKTITMERRVRGNSHARFLGGDGAVMYCPYPTSWEHIINDEKIITRENIALCCRGCNSSKGQKQLSIWLQSKYCKEHGITVESVAPIIKRAIANGQ